MMKKNKYANRSKISEKKIREIVKYFSMDLEATKIAELTNLNRNTINRYVKAIREKIVDFCAKESPFSGEIEVDESYFGAKRVKGNEGEEQREKQLYLVFLNAMEKFIQRLFQIAQKTLYKQ